MNDAFYEIIKIMGEPLFYNIHAAPHYCLDEHQNKRHIEKWFRIIYCQQCRKRFIAECCDPVYVDICDYDGKYKEILKDSWGDPPRHEECSAGDTMLSMGMRKLTKKEINNLIAQSKKFKKNIRGGMNEFKI